MTDQQTRDLAPIMEAFPMTEVGDDGFPQIVFDVCDKEGDPHLVEVNIDGIATIGAQEGSPVAFDAQTASLMREHVLEAKRLYAAWHETETGRAYSAARLTSA